jgi:signal transduction histidine kinase
VLASGILVVFTGLLRGRFSAMVAIFALCIVLLADALRYTRRQKAEAEQELLIVRRNLARAERMESMGYIAGSVAHDINNMLQGIISWAELIAEDLREKNQIDHALDNILQAVDDAAVLAKHLQPGGTLLVLPRPMGLKKTLLKTKPAQEQDSV